jgi:hypothetical protein
MTAKLLGTKQFRANLETISKVDFPGLYKRVLDETSDLTLRDSIDMTPIDTGFLRSTAVARVNEVSARGGSAEVSYSAPYSIPVHEVLTSHHPIGSAKFLERALMFMMPLFPKMLGNAIKTFLGRAYYKKYKV